jgi:GlpG protein
MRQLTRYDVEDQARVLGDALVADGIESRVEPASEGGFVVWVHDERDVSRAREILAEYTADAAAPRFAEATSRAREIRREREKAASKDRGKTVRLRERWEAQRSTGIGPATLVMIVACIGVAIFLEVYEGDSVRSALSFASYRVVGQGTRALIQWSGIEDILSGEVWRLVTPMFLHYGFLHLFFNCWWLKDLGSMVERLQSTLFFLVFAILCAAFSNSLQYFFAGHPQFGGMSGVNYGLFGLIWVRSRLDPASGYAIAPMTVGWMMIWFVVCWTGILGPVANWAHTGGLVFGAILGLLIAKGPSWLRR